LRRGQSAVEFALVLPMLLMLIGGIVQYGLLFATKHSLIQVGRDVGRWAATQVYDSGGNPITDCSDPATASPRQPMTQADLIAQQSQLMGYSAGDWNASNFNRYANNTPLPAAPPSSQSVEVVWTIEAGVCPPLGPLDVSWVTIRLTHRAPVILPGFPALPGLGTCDASGCYLAVSTTARFRMEVVPAP
jgi:hypothetical protein